MNFLKLHWKTLLGIPIAAFIVLAVLPVLFIHRPAEWQNFAAWSTWFYAVITFFTLLVISGGAYFAFGQLAENTKSRKLSIVLDLWRQYATEQMGQAIRTVWTIPPAEILASDHLDNQRRMVSDFWNMIGWAVKEGLVEIDLVRSRFGPAIDVWEKLRPIEVLLRKERVVKFHQPDLNDEEAAQLAIQFVENHQSAGWLYQEWKKRDREVLSGKANASRGSQ